MSSARPFTNEDITKQLEIIFIIDHIHEKRNNWEQHVRRINSERFFKTSI